MDKQQQEAMHFPLALEPLQAEKIWGEVGTNKAGYKKFFYGGTNAVFCNELTDSEIQETIATVDIELSRASLKPHQRKDLHQQARKLTQEVARRLWRQLNSLPLNWPQEDSKEQQEAARSLAELNDDDLLNAFLPDGSNAEDVTLELERRTKRQEDTSFKDVFLGRGIEYSMRIFLAVRRKRESMSTIRRAGDTIYKEYPLAI